MHAQAYDTLAARPDARDFFGRDETRLVLTGTSVRFSGYDVGWLGMRADGRAQTPLSAYEVNDAMATVAALGGTVVRARPISFVLAGTPARWQPDPAGLAMLDMMITSARDAGLKVIVPLAGSGADCTALPEEVACSLAGARGVSQPGIFFTDAGVRADFLAGLAGVLDHANSLTGVTYKDDPTILAWENCLQCGAVADPAAVSAWSEQVGHAIKQADPHHLYENGAFAGRIGPDTHGAVAAALYATPSVDIVGDMLETDTDAIAARTRLAAASGAVGAADRVYVLDSIAWTPSVWKTIGDLNAWIFALTHERGLSGVIAGRLSGHADMGGYLPPPPSDPAHGVAALYFPGIPSPDMDAATMTERGRALRRLSYGIADIVDAPAYLQPPIPLILSSAHGHVVWRGAAGASRYSVERSADPNAPGSWHLVCDACATDLDGGWQDPAPTAPPSWYRVIPANINGHRAVPSEPVHASK